MSRRWIWLALALALGRPGVAAAAAARPVLMLNQVDISKPPAVRIYLTDLDSGLSPITDRKAQHYRLLVDGIPQTAAEKLQRFHQIGEPVALTLIVQVSPALRDALTDATDASKRLIDALPAGSRIGVVAYTDVVVQDLKPTTPAAAKEAVDGLRVRDDSVEVQLPDAIKDALEGIDNPSLPRQRLLLVLSDGLTTDLNPTVFSELGRRAQDKGVIVHAIGYAPLEPGRLRTLHELSKRGGGTMREARDAGAVSRAFAAVGEEIRNQAVVTYQIPTFFDGKLHDIQIETPGGQASNIVPIELPKLTPTSDPDRAWYKSTWFLVSMLALVQAGLVALVLLALRWRRRPAASLQQRYAREEEGEEEEEEEEEEREEEEGEEEEEVRASEGDQELADEDRTRERRAEPARVGRGGEQTGRSLRAVSSREVRPLGAGSRGPREGRLAAERPATGEEGGGGSPPATTDARRRLGALLDPDPLLLDSRPQPGSAIHGGGEKPVPGGQRPTVIAPDDAPVRVKTRPEESLGGLLLPDPKEFLRSEEGAAEPVQRGGAQGPMAQGLSLPDPEEFMRQVRGGEPAAPREPSAPARAERADRSVSRSSSSRPAGASPAVAGSGIPLQPPAVVPAALPPEAGVQPGRFLDRKTKVIAIEEMNAADYVAWIVPLGGPPHPAVVVTDGFTIGSSPDCQLQLQGVDVLPAHGVLRLDSRGFRLETVGERGETLAQPLSDDDRFLIGSYEFAFKVATRADTKPLAAARLEVLDGMDQGRRVALPENEPITIGSHSSSRLVVRGDGVEKVHAVAVRTGELCTISDLGSASGLGYQGQPVGYRKIRSWEEVMIGTVRVVYILEDVGAGEPVEYGDEQKTWHNVQSKR